MASHKFKLGSMVELTGALRFNAAPGPYEIVQLLPGVDGEFEYRIRAAGEGHERMVRESELVRYKE